MVYEEILLLTAFLCIFVGPTAIGIIPLTEDKENQKESKLSESLFSRVSELSNSDTELQDKKLESLLEGTWQREDEKTNNSCNDRIKISLSSQVENVCIAINQIYVTIRYELNSKKKELYALLVTPNALGKEGAKIPWQDYDRKKPIATIDVSNLSESKIYIKWNGFYHKKEKTYHKHGQEYEGAYRKSNAKQGDDERNKYPKQKR